MINGAALPLIINYIRKMKSTTTTTTLLLVATSLHGLLLIAATNQHPKIEDRPAPQPNPMYPLKSLFVRTKGQYAHILTQELQRKGKYHNYLDIKQIRSHYCLGWDVILKITVDDTTFFNPQTLWPKRPEVEWVEDALNKDMTWVTWIHFDSWGDDPYHSDDEVFCSKQSVSIDLSENDDDCSSTTRNDEDQQIDVLISADYTTHKKFGDKKQRRGNARTQQGNNCI